MGTNTNNNDGLRAEGQQIYTNELLRFVIDQIPDVFILKDDKGDFLLGNQTIAQLYNTTPDEMIGKQDCDFGVPKNQADFFRQNVLEIIASGEQQIVYEKTTDAKSGETRHFRSIKTPIKDPLGNNQIIITTQDITDIIASQEPVVQSESRLQTVLEVVQEGVWDWDMKTGKVLHNRQWFNTLGVSSETMESHIDEFKKHVHPDDLEQVFSRLQLMLEGRVETYSSEHRMLKSDGSVMWVQDRGRIARRDENGEPIQIIGSFIDITESRDQSETLSRLVEERTQELKERNNDLKHENLLRKKSEEDLKQNKLFLDSIIEHIPNMLFIKDTKDLNFVRLNNAAEKLLGISRQELIGRNDYDFFPKKQADRFTLKDREVIDNNFSAVIEEELTDGLHGTRILQTHKVCINDKDGEPEFLLGISKDITERKKAENLIEKTSEILEMVAKGEPAAKIYDEIALMYESRYSGMRCSMLILEDGKLLHGGAPSLPEEYRNAVHRLKNGPSVGSCGTSTYTGQRVLVENIETDPKWAKLKHIALPHGMRSCWSEPIMNSGGKVLGAFGMYYNHPALPNEGELIDLKSAARLAGIVMEREQNQKRIHEMAYYDSLTGLASRTLFHQTIEETLKQSRRHKDRFGLLYIDLDNFKGVNDTLGHDAGDLLLHCIAQRLKSVSREIDLAGRLGGDEFCILVKGVDNDYSTAHVAQRCLDVISEPIELSGRKFTPGCSIGIAHYPEDGEDQTSLLKAADTSLYCAKENGKNQYAFYKKELTEKANHRFQMEQALWEALDKQQLSVVYQPQVKVETGEIVGIEVLCRWYHDELGQVSPTEFISTAERIGFIKPITEFVLRTACEQAVSWEKACMPSLFIAVNISPVLFKDQSFVMMVTNILDETGMDPTKLELEVTESVIHTNIENLSVIQALKKLGVLIAVDDFGTGYSSFASLKHLAADCLKIDKYFIQDMLDDENTKFLVESMIAIAHNFKHRIVAEGVETSSQFDLLKKLRCDLAQGYLFSKPVDANSITNLLSCN